MVCKRHELATTGCKTEEHKTLHLFFLNHVRFSYQTIHLLHKICGLLCREEQDMTLCEFSPLPEKEKTTLLYEQGVYVGKRKLGSLTILLYQLDGFYAEVYYRQYRRVIDRIRCFADTARLDPYLAEINVEHLV